MPKDDRRSKRTGSLHQRASDGCWVASVELPSIDGKRRRKVVVRAAKGDAQRELKKLRDALERAGDLPTSSITLSTWLDVWWERYAAGRLKVSTRPSYQSKIEQYIRPSIGRYRLDRLGAEHVVRLRDYVLKEKKLSSSTAQGAHRVLSVILSDAEREGKISRNPCSLVKAPSRAVHRSKEGVTYLTSAQARALLASVDAGDGNVSQELALWSTALLTGMRPGERLGLTRDAIDFERGVITVSWQLQRLAWEHGCGEQGDDGWPCGRTKGGNCPDKRLDIPGDQEVVRVDGGIYMSRPKTSAGWRVVPMAGPLHAVLQRYVETHGPGLNGLVFTRDGRRPLDPTDDNERWDAALQRAGLPDVNRHSARHTCNTILTELGVPVDVRQKILGHASRAVNEAVYTHTSDVRVVEAMKALGVAVDWRVTA